MNVVKNEIKKETRNKNWEIAGCIGSMAPTQGGSAGTNLNATKEMMGRGNW